MTDAAFGYRIDVRLPLLNPITVVDQALGQALGLLERTEATRVGAEQELEVATPRAAP